MKVVLFCGGQGMRLREYTDQVPKPMVPVGDRPVLWHVMKYYAHYGHTEFILCLGYKGAAIKSYFLNYQEEISNDFRLHDGERQLFTADIDRWDITFVDTGQHTAQGERLRRVQGLVGDDELFLANYADGLTDLDLDAYMDRFIDSGAVASVMAVRPWLSYHRLAIDENSRLEGLESIADSDIWFNGGYFAFRREVFDYLEKGDDVVDPFLRLAKERKALVQRHEGFFAPMDTFKDKMGLDERYDRGDAPWVLWKTNGT